ncbi:MAG: DUF4340 domain-containing protein [bacterium]
MKRYIITLIIILIFAGLYAYIRFYETGEVPAEGEEKQIEVYSIKKDEIRKVEIIYPRRQVVCEKRGGRWTLRATEGMRVNDAEIDMLLDAVVDFKASREIGTRRDLASFGLMEPDFKVRITLADGKKYTLLMGVETPAGGKSYIMLESDNKIYTADTQKINSLRKDSGDLRDKSILTFDREKAEEITVEKGGVSVHCAKNEKGVWNIAGKKGGKSCETEANAVLSTLKYTDARQFLGAHEKQREDGQQSVVLKLKLEGNKEKKIIVGERRDDDLYVTNVERGETYIISGALADDVEKMFKAGNGSKM